jgi:hypothetical protein
MDFNKRGHDRIMTNYRDHIVGLSNGTIMRVGVCENCKELLVSGEDVLKTAKNILKKQKKYWDSDDHAPIGYESFEITDPNTNEEKHAEEKQHEHFKQTDQLERQKKNYEEQHEKTMERMELKEKRRQEKQAEKEEKEKEKMETSRVREAKKIKEAQAKQNDLPLNLNNDLPL